MVELEYHDIPSGVTKVPVTIELAQHGPCVSTEVIAGSLAFRVGEAKLEGNSTRESEVLDTLQPQTGWIMYRTWW